MSYAIVLHDSIKKAILQLQKRYPNVTEDVRRAIRELQENPRGGDVVSGANICRKIRVANSDSRKGKRGGYRLLYSVDFVSKTIHLLLIYPKSIRDDVPTLEIIRLLRDAGLL
jgi:mRNA-degrading endonuclease RelE of RelBE toxin-antitoxin system